MTTTRGDNWSIVFNDPHASDMVLFFGPAGDVGSFPHGWEACQQMHITGYVFVPPPSMMLMPAAPLPCTHQQPPLPANGFHVYSDILSYRSRLLDCMLRSVPRAMSGTHLRPLVRMDVPDVAVAVAVLRLMYGGDSIADEIGRQLTPSQVASGIALARCWGSSETETTLVSILDAMCRRHAHGAANGQDGGSTNNTVRAHSHARDGIVALLAGERVVPDVDLRSLPIPAEGFPALSAVMSGTDEFIAWWNASGIFRRRADGSADVRKLAAVDAIVAAAYGENIRPLLLDIIKSCAVYPTTSVIMVIVAIMTQLVAFVHRRLASVPNVDIGGAVAMIAETMRHCMRRGIIMESRVLADMSRLCPALIESQPALGELATVVRQRHDAYRADISSHSIAAADALLDEAERSSSTTAVLGAPDAASITNARMLLRGRGASLARVMALPFGEFVRWLSRDDLVIDSENDVALLAVLWTLDRARGTDAAASSALTPEQALELRACIAPAALGPAFFRHVLSRQPWWSVPSRGNNDDDGAVAGRTVDGMTWTLSDSGGAAAPSRRSGISAQRPLVTGRVCLSPDQRAALLRTLSDGRSRVVTCKSPAAYVNGFGLQTMLAVSLSLPSNCGSGSGGAHADGGGLCVTAGIEVDAMSNDAMVVRIIGSVCVEGVSDSAMAHLADSVQLTPDGGASSSSSLPSSTGMTVASFSGRNITDLIKGGLMRVTVVVTELDSATSPVTTTTMTSC